MYSCFALIAAWQNSYEYISRALDWTTLVIESRVSGTVTIA